MLVTTNRLMVILLVWLFLFVAFSAKLFYIQVIQSAQLSTGAVMQRSVSFPLEPARGAILDRNMIPLTDPRIRPTVVAFPQFIEDMDRASSAIALANPGHNDDTIRSILEFASEKPRPSVVTLGEGISDKAAKRLMAAGIPGITVALQTQRYGPRAVARHVVGHLVQADNAGASGIEKRFDSKTGSLGLRGRRPRSVAPLVSGVKRIIPGLGFHELPASPRASVVLSLDVRVQRAVESVLDAHSMEKGAVVVLDTKSGDVLAMASRPDFDPQNIVQAIGDTRSPLVNRAVEPYYPGSVFKVIVAAAALDGAGVDPSLITVCAGTLDVGGGEPIKCTHHRDAPGVVTLRDSMAYSCNPVYVSLAKDIGARRILEYARRLGIGERWGELPEGSPGTTRLPDSMRGLAHLAIGQEYVKTTPLEITAAIAAIANDGIYKEPRLVHSVLRNDGRVLESFREARGVRVIQSDVSSVLRDWLEATVQYGTGKLASIDDGSAGKTGTAESAQSSWFNEKWDAWFVGWAPRYDARYTIGVFVEDGGSGPGRAAPIFRDIASRVVSIGGTP